MAELPARTDDTRIPETIRRYTEGPGFTADQWRGLRTLLMLAADRIDLLEERLAVQDEEVLSLESAMDGTDRRE